MIRLVPLLLILVGMGMAVYYLGKRWSWWGESQSAGPGRHARPAATATSALSAGSMPEESLPPVADIWRRISIMHTGKWRTTRQNKQLRIWLEGKIAAPDAVLHIERVTHPLTDPIRVEVFTFRPGKDGPESELRDVRVPQVDGEILPVYLNQAFSAKRPQQPTDDDLRRLRTDLSMSREVNR